MDSSKNKHTNNKFTIFYKKYINPILFISFISFQLYAQNLTNQKQLNFTTDVKSTNYQKSDHITKLLPTPIGIGGDSNLFGYSISTENNRAVVGAPNMDTTGLVYVYDYDGVDWNLTSILEPDDNSGSELKFGISVSLNNNKILIGASQTKNNYGSPSGSAYIFELIEGEWLQTHELFSADRFGYGYFGHSVSLINNRALVGAYRLYDSDTNGAGAAFIFDLVSSNWVESQKLFMEDGRNGDSFGYSVDLSENRLIIGAYREEDTGFTNSGSAYIYDLNDGIWSLSQKLTTTIKNSYDYFGFSVSINGDHALIGAYGNDAISEDAGAAYIFDYNGSEWTQSSMLLPLINNNPKNFGSSTKLHNNQAIIGVLYHNNNGFDSGAAYIFEQTNQQWLQTQIIRPNDGDTQDLFGFSLGASSTALFISSIVDDDNGPNSGSVYTFKQNNGLWSQDEKLNSNEIIGSTQDSFGISVSFKGNRVAIGAHLDDDKGYNSGSVYIFDLINDSWNLTQKITANDIDENSYFGYSVSLSGDRLLIGAPQGIFVGTGDIGSAYIFDLIDGIWTQTQKINASDGIIDNRFGFSVSLEQNRALVGAYSDNSGSAYIYNLIQGNWLESQKLQPINNSLSGKFGFSVSLGNSRLLIGAPRAYNEPDSNGYYRRGAAYVFDMVNDQWLQTQKLFDPYQDIDSSILADFGSSVSLSNNRALIGATFDTIYTHSMGSAHIFDLNDGVWERTQKLAASDFGQHEIFGYSVSLYNNKAIVGAPRADFITSNTGAAYAYDLINGSWSQTKKIISSDGQRYDYFGTSVSLFEDKVFIGANNNDTDSGTNSGAAYLFDLTEFIFASGFEVNK